MARDSLLPPSQEEGDKVAVDFTPPTFSLDELLAQLRPEESKEGFTARELCGMAGLPKTRNNIGRVREKCGDLTALGKWEYVGWQTRFCDVLEEEYTAKAWRPKGDLDDIV